jgi:putative oxidoreductase
MEIGRLAARAVIGGLFVGHGTQKLFGWFGGPGMQGTEQMMGALEMRPTRVNAIAAGVSETAGGVLLMAGAATPLAASALIGTMITAIRKVHQPNGPWAAQGGWEYNAVLISALTALVDAGPGDLSLDAVVGREQWGPGWAVAGLALGAAASTAAIALGRRASGPAGVSASPAGETGEAGAVAAATEGETAGDPVTTESS